jgi:hypothetical protein
VTLFLHRRLRNPTVPVDDTQSGFDRHPFKPCNNRVASLLQNPQQEGWFIMFATPNRRHKLAMLIVATALLLTGNPGFAQVSPPPRAAPAPAPGYADLADLFAAAPLVFRARIVAATAIKMPPTAARTTRFYVEADILTLIRGAGGLPPRVNYLVDVAPDSRGKPPRLKKSEMLIAAVPVPGRPGSVQLIARDSQLIWSPVLDGRVRALVASVLAADAPPVVTGISSAFHVTGTVPGEGETQIFLATATGAPVSLTIMRRQGEAPRWALALGEIVDDAATVPPRDSLAWYRLACFLPGALPVAAARELTPVDADAARVDYAFVISELGPCGRQRR